MRKKPFRFGARDKGGFVNFLCMPQLIDKRCVGVIWVWLRTIRFAHAQCQHTGWFIPLKKVKSHLSHKIHDRTLSHLCWKSRCAFRKWKDAGRPRSGLLYDERRKCKRDVQHNLNRQRGNWERKRIQKRDSICSAKNTHKDFALEVRVNTSLKSCL